MLKVLLIDDEEFMLTNFARLVGRLGAEVTTAATGAAGIKAFKENKPDLVILDIILPDINGREVFDRLCAIDPTARICFVSGSEYELKEAAAMNIGALGYMTKPIFVDDIRNIVEKVKKSGDQ